MALRRTLLWLLAPLAACSSPTVATQSPVTVSEVSVNRGVVDPGLDPTVVAVVTASGAVCTGALIAEDVVVTARHCTAVLSRDLTCPAQGPQVLAQENPTSFEVLLGDEIETAVFAAQGLDVLVPTTDVLCDADIALILLDRPVTSVTPAVPEGLGVAKGHHVRTVEYAGSPAAKELVEHAPVEEVSRDEFRVAEGSCRGLGGGPAFDEATGHVVGILARFGSSCDGKDAFDVYTRLDAFFPLVEQALSASMESGKKRSMSDTRDPTDIGAACFTGSDCGTGVCVNDGISQYCSRACNPTDRCPSTYKCVVSEDSPPVCVQSLAQ